MLAKNLWSNKTEVVKNLVNHITHMVGTLTMLLIITTQLMKERKKKHGKKKYNEK